MTLSLVRRAAGSVRPRTSPAAAPKPEGFRADIEGLRAIAVVLVMLAHAEVPGLSGGFIGVDVFFVISGFLITGLLYREMRSTKRLSLLRFWARRAKRLLPASAIVLVATALLTLLLVPSPRWSTIGGDLIASALYVVNWRFADQSVDYLAGEVGSSPVQHYWSLAVEEQFYVLWPLLVLVCAWVARQFGVRLRTAMIGGVLLVIVPSFAWSIFDTATAPAPAYFQTPTRLWELGIGALVALLAPFWQRSTAGAATMLGWGGLVTLVLSALTITQQLAWPSSNALMPALATAAVIAGGFRAREAGPLRLLGRPLMQRTGGLSYGLYLWHWPLLAVVAARWGMPSWPVALLIVTASALPAHATYVLLEDPVRRSALLSRVPRLSLAVGAACMAVGIAAGLGLTGLASAQVRDAPTSEARGAGAAVAPSTPAASTSTSTSPRPTSSTTSTPTRPPPTTLVVPPTDARLLKPPAPGSIDLTPTSITPDPLKARADTPKHGCLLEPADTTPRRCELGDRNGRTTIALVGDSKADQWADALHQVAKVQGWRLDVYAKSGCPLNDQMLYGTVARGPFRECRTWTTAVLRELTEAHKPTVVLTTGQTPSALTPAGKSSDQLMVDGYVSLWKRLQSQKIGVVALADVPTPDRNIEDCVATHRTSPNSSCTFARNAGLGTPPAAAAAARAMAPLVSVNDWVCPQPACPAVIGNVLIYRSAGHITSTFAMTLAEVLRARLVPAVQRATLSR